MGTTDGILLGNPRFILQISDKVHIHFIKSDLRYMNWMAKLSFTFKYPAVRRYLGVQIRPANFIIYGDRLEIENANNPHGEGLLSPTNFSPFPKNPSIAKFFMQLGRFDELGSGILNVNKYIKAYSGKDNPQFIEEATFKTIITTGGEADGTDVGAIDGATKGGNTKVETPT